jgi:hypothetical protein
MRSGPDRETIEISEQIYFEPKFFKVYNHIQTRYARRVGFQAWGIYCTLKQFADWNSSVPQCTVSMERIAIIWGVTRRTVRRGVRKLRDFGLIRVEKNQASSTYTILKIKVPKSQLRQDKFVLSDRSEMSPQRGQKRPLYQNLFTRPSLPGGEPVDAASKGKKHQPGKATPPPKFTQKDFDERDYRKWHTEMKALGGADSDEEWVRQARTAAARAGILPGRIVEVLKQVYPHDANVPKIARKRA